MSAHPEPLAVLGDATQAAAVLHPLRRAILERLRDPDSATGVAQALGLPRQRVNYHVRQLQDEGLVREVGERRKGNLVERLVQATARHYLVAPGVADPSGGATITRDRFSSAYLTAVAARTVGELGVLRERAAEAGKKLPTLTLEATVRFATPADQHAFAEDLANAFAGIVAKHHAENAPDGRDFRVFAAGYPALPETPAPAPGGEEPT